MLTYGALMEELQIVKGHGVAVDSIGKSTLGQDIPCVFFGDNKAPCLIVQCAIHAREHITSLLALCMIKHLIANKHLTLNGGIIIVPMSNPDGVRIATEGIGWIQDPLVRNRLLLANGGSDDFSLFKANANGVDLNVNFDARWGEGTQNSRTIASANYIGESANSEVECQHLIDLAYNCNAVATLSYHCKGEEVYWQFGQEGETYEKHQRYAQAISKYTGYKLVSGEGSVGGYKDWCISKLGIPSYTIEVGNDNYNHPYPYSQIDDIVARNIDLPRRLINSLVKAGCSGCMQCG